MSDTDAQSGRNKLGPRCSMRARGEDARRLRGAVARGGGNADHCREGEQVVYKRDFTKGDGRER
jgi:hypothetical protein